MITTHNLGFPRIGQKRELKFALESFWKRESNESALEAVASDLRRQNWAHQAKLDLTPVGDFSLYDQVLDMSFTLGNIPQRVNGLQGTTTDSYFRVARGRSAHDAACSALHAGEMTKWFDTNYHYIVPEFTADTEFSLDASRLLQQFQEAAQFGVKSKPVIIGPLTYLWLGKSKDGSNRLHLLERLIPVYAELLHMLAEAGADWVQIDEPILVTELDTAWRRAFDVAYHGLKASKVKLLLTSYFGRLEGNLQLACGLPVAGLHLDAINAREEVARVVDWLPRHKVLSLGIINGRNIWKTNLEATLDWLEPLHGTLGDRLWLAPSCSLLHVPVDLECETALDPEIRSWLAFARQKLDELSTLATALNRGRSAVASELAANADVIQSRQTSLRVHHPTVNGAVAGIVRKHGERASSHTVRARKQADHLRLPLYPTTTIGSFPQTQSIRHARLAFRQGQLSETAYDELMKREIRQAVAEQEALGLDVFVHGEPERNDMVEYFGERLEGYAFSQAGWVQSYGSRCVKPPIIYGDVSRPAPITVSWAQYAQSITTKPMKGMLTGPVTLLNWSFVRDDQPRASTCAQLALAIREEVLDLEKAGIRIIQIDEAALREGLPLRQSEWAQYLDWAVEAFRIAANGVSDDTQIHTHMCYSEFNDIIEAIARMDADVITIETSRSDMALLDAFRRFEYPNDIGPGVYDIHSPNVPSQAHIVAALRKAAKHIPPERLWVNPDCGLKTRHWDEVRPALANMVAAAAELRQSAQATMRTGTPLYAGVLDSSS